MQKYKIILQQLLKEIRSGKYAPDGRFPSNVQLMRRFGVSRSTVRQAIDKLCREGLLHSRRGSGTYLPVRQTYGRIGLIIHGSDYCEFFSPFSRHISHLCQRKSCGLLYADLSDGPTLKRINKVRAIATDWVREGVDGIIFQPVELVPNACEINAAILSIFDKASIPIVLIDSDIVSAPARSGYDLAAVNHFEAGLRMGEHLRSTGAQRIAYLSQRHRAPCVLARELGVRTAATGLPLAGETLYAEPDDKARIRRFLTMKKPDAIACYNDRYAVMLMKTLIALGKRIPEDIRVAGFDDVNYAKLSTPALTTLHQPCEELGDLAFEMLRARMRNPSIPVREAFLLAPLVVRESTVKKC